MAVKELLDEQAIRSYPKTSGSRGIHVYVRIEPRWTFHGVRAAALAVAREIERRMPGRATAKWWKEERVGVFLDYNQNAKDKTIASAYSVRPVPGARVSTPLRWDEVPDAEPADLRLDTVRQRLQDIGDPSAGMDATPHSLEPLLELARLDIEERGLDDAPWPPHYAKQAGEPKRVAPSRAKKEGWRRGRAGAQRGSRRPGGYC
jgi:DNA primase